MGPCSGMPPFPPVQLCKDSTECGDAGACAAATCPVGVGSSVTLEVCGVPLGCTP